MVAGFGQCPLDEVRCGVVLHRIGRYGIRPQQPAPADERIAGPVRCEVEVQVLHAVAEDVHVHLVCGGGLAQSCGHPCEHRAERCRLRSVEVGDGGDVAVRFEMGETCHGTAQGD